MDAKANGKKTLISRYYTAAALCGLVSLLLLGLSLRVSCASALKGLAAVALICALILVLLPQLER